MPLILNEYRNSIDYCFYQSDNIVYSECIDKKDDYKDLTVIFKDGRCYNYKGVDVNDYVMFKNALSNGKALNEHIIKDRKNPKYTTLKLADRDLNSLEDLKKEIIERQCVSQNNITFVLHKNTFNSYCTLDKNGIRIYEGSNKIKIEDMFNLIGITLEVENVEESPEELLGK